MSSNIPESLERMEAEIDGRQCELSRKCRIELEEACQYARDNSLTCDYEAIPRPDVEHLAAKLVSPSPDVSLDGQLKLLPGFEIPSSISVDEIWDLTEQSARLIGAACQRASSEQIDMLKRRVLGLGASKNLKVELPLLQSDPSRDLRDLQRSIEAAFSSPLKSHHFPLEPVNTERDEGLEFPSSSQKFAQSMMQSIKEERLDVSKELLVYLSECLKDNWSTEKQLSYIHRQIEFKKNPGTEPVTPPLSPMPEEPSHFIPEGDVCNVPILSDPSSTLSSELREAENTLFGLQGDADIFGPDQLITSPSQLFPDSQSSLQLLTSTLPKRNKPQDLRVDVPLLSRFDLEDGTDPAGILDPTHAMVAVAEQHAGGDFEEQMRHDMAEDDPKDSFETLIRESATTAKRKVEQEQLEPLDSISRVKIPLADFSIEEPAWKEHENDPEAMFKSLRASNPEIFSILEWPDTRSGEMNMVWKPMKDVKITESFDSAPESAVGQFLATRPESEVPTSANYVWKREGLAILRDEQYEDGEEIPPAFSMKNHKRNLMELIQTKKRMLESEACEKDSAHARHKGQLGSQNGAVNGHNHGMLLDEGLPAVGRLLDNYLDLHAPKRRKKANLEHPNNTCLTMNTSSKEPHKKKNAVAQECSSNEGIAAWTPPLQPPDQPPKVIVSLNLSRAVMRHIEKLLPGIDITDRDYDAYNTSRWIPGSTCRSEIVSPLAAEADVTLSPITGVLLTTMVKVRQKPVPGANGQSVIRNRIERVSARYERLVVLVSENSKDESMTEISSADTTTFAEFQGYLATLETNVTSYYVGGGEKALAGWVAWCICKHQAEGQQTKDCVLEVESFWELFLRRAGMNVYASQAVLASLKDPGQACDGGAPAQSALAAFVNMTPEERSLRFETMMGGTRVLESVSKALDPSWQ